MEVRDEINSLNTKKSNVANSITSKQLQDHIDYFKTTTGSY